MMPAALALTLSITVLAMQDAPPAADLEVAPRTQFQSPEARLEQRLDALANAGTPEEAVPLVDEIHALWAHSGSDTISLLMDRGEAAETAGNDEIAARMYDHVTRLAPDYAEGWLASGRVATHFEDWTYALETLNTALQLEPRRYDAYLTLARVLEQAQEFQGALDAYDEALSIFPAHEGAREARDRIAARLAGRAL